MKISFKTHRHLCTPLMISFLLSSVITLGVLINYFQAQPQVPMFYSLPRESQHLATKEWLFLWPATSFLISFIHLFIAQLIKDSNSLLSKLFVWGTVGLQVLLSLAWVRIVLIIS